MNELHDRDGLPGDDVVPDGAGAPSVDAVPDGVGRPSVEIVELERVRVAAVRSIVAPEDVPDFMSDALGLVAAALREAGASPAGPSFARYFAMTPDGLYVAAGFPVAEQLLGPGAADPFPKSGVVHPGELPAGPAAVATHVGGYDGLEAAWTALRGRIDELGRHRGDDPWEVYFIGPGSGVDEAEWRTELVWPLAPQAGEG